MKILITGGSGFLGARLARTLLAQGQLSLAGGPAQRIESVTLADRAPPPDDLGRDPRVKFVGGDLNEQIASRAIPAAGTDVVFHLAAAVSGECEADFDLGMRSNFDATRALLDACRALGNKPTFVFASSLAVFGNLPGQPLPEPIRDMTLPTPQSSYGIQKFIGEQLVADYARKRFIVGRSVRLMTVSVRPGKPNGAASSFLSGMIREPLAGQKAACPVAPGDFGRAVVAGPHHRRHHPRRAGDRRRVGTADGGEPAVAAHHGGRDGRGAGKGGGQGRRRPAGLDARSGNRPPGQDLARRRDVRARPRARTAGRPDFESVVRDYIRENPGAVKLPVR